MKEHRTYKDGLKVTWWEGWTNYPIPRVDPPFKKTEPRECEVWSCDGDRFVEVRIPKDGWMFNEVIPASALFASSDLKVPFDTSVLPKPRWRYDYPKPSVTVDGVVFGLDGLKTMETLTLKILLIKRRNKPFKGRWALPGGFVDTMDESLEDAARRELEEETHIKGLFLEQLYTFGAPRRDPRGRVISVAYLALVDLTTLDVQSGSDAEDAQWIDVQSLPLLAFDHTQIIEMGLARLEGKVRYQPLGFELLPKKFTLGQLQQMYEAILRRPLDKRNFRKKILDMEILKPLNEKTRGTMGRSALMYQFDRRQYDRLVKSGYNFEI